ncbi:Nodulation protein D 2 [Asticcacaulis sp. MM231]|uniref:LysR family transcriptional regulator n=1 Tax=Asticcacaulis sp. MM231 TaxID=3157666 RepID=UPI0032D592EA
MADLDLNLLVALDALLSERSVTAAARKLNLSTSAMSRQLSRLREAMGDPVLVPAGRAMVPTPRAEAVASQVRALNAEIRSVLQPATTADIRTLKRIFTLRANEAFVIIHGARLTAAVAEVAPDVKLCFAPKPDKDIRALRDGTVDLDIGVISGDGAELRAQTLYHDAFVGVTRTDHPLLAQEITPQRFTAYGHVVTSRRGQFRGPVDAALNTLGLSRNVQVVVPSFPALLAIVATSDLIGQVPRSFCEAGNTIAVMTFPLPVPTPQITVSQIWHPRMDADAGHRWLRGAIFSVFQKKSPGLATGTL